MSRRIREHLTAAILTALVALILMGLAGRFHTRSASSEVPVQLRFARVHSTPAPIRISTPSGAGVRRIAIDATHLPTARAHARPLERPVSRAMRKADPLSLGESIEPERSGRTSRARRPPIVRTRPLRPSRLALTPATELPQPRSRRVVSLPKPRKRVVEATAPAPATPLEAVQQEISTDAITEWMRLQPADLPPGIRRHMEYVEGNLTSAATLTHEGVPYEIYLMARSVLRELHVVLVTAGISYYLIDRSFQREGRTFRTGTVRRRGHVITGIVSEERAPASAEARHFYQVFLSWWDAERLKLP